MSVSGKNVLVLGGTGVVGTGIINAFLEAGAHVIAVARSASKATELESKFQGKPLKTLVGGFDSAEQATKSKDDVVKILGGGTLNHIVSTLGFALVGETPVSKGSITLLHDTLKDIEPTFFSIGAFLDLVKDTEGASYTVVNGGLRHNCFMPNMWSATVKNTALDGIILSLYKETEDAKVRANCVCIHFGVAPHGGTANQWGMPSSDTYDLGPVFVKVATNAIKGESVCLNSIEDAKKYASA